MRRFDFPLEQVLRHRERREQQAELREQHAAAALRTVQAECTTLRCQLDEVAAALHGKMGAALDVTAWLAAYRQAERLGSDLQSAETRQAAALQALQEAAVDRKKKALEAEALRRLKQSRKQKHDDDVAKAEQIALDEIGMRRWRDWGNEL
jgi:flagellar export protein FliJ